MERPKVVGPGLVRATYPLDHHAIGIRSEYFDRILRTWRVGSSKAGHDGTATDLPRTNSDVELARLAKEIPMYACFPNLAWQRKDYSDQAERAYSNYTPEGDQLHCQEVLNGIGAEVLGGKRWQGLPFANQSAGRWDQARLTGMPFKGVGIRDFMKLLAEAPLRIPVTHPVLAVLMPGKGKPTQPEIWQAFSRDLQRDGGKILNLNDGESPSEADSTLQGIKEGIPSQSLDFLQRMLHLLRTALEDPGVTHFVFCGDATVPLMPWREMRRQLRLDGRPWLKVRNADRLWEADKPRARRMQNAPRVEKASWRDHRPWLLLDRETAGLMVEDDLTAHFAEVEAPEECYFGTVLRLKGYPVEELCLQREVVWNRPSSWKNLNAIHAGEMLRTGCFFGGEFGEESNIAELGLHLDGMEMEASR